MWSLHSQCCQHLDTQMEVTVMIRERKKERLRHAAVYFHATRYKPIRPNTYADRAHLPMTAAHPEDISPTSCTMFAATPQKLLRK